MTPNFKVETKRQVYWHLPLENWLKVNFDGASKGNPGEAGGRGLCRDKDGKVL